VEVLVANASPVMFKDGESSAQRLQRYLAGEETDVSYRHFLGWSHCFIIGSVQL
jgi:hypothetical protein